MNQSGHINTLCVGVITIILDTLERDKITTTAITKVYSMYVKINCLCKSWLIAGGFI